MINRINNMFVISFEDIDKIKRFFNNRTYLSIYIWIKTKREN